VNGRVTASARIAWASVGGLLGSRLPENLRFPEKMTFRFRGRDVSPGEVAQHCRQHPPGRDTVFFLHGLMADDSCWSFSSFDMTRAWEQDFGVFPVHLCYNTGLHVSDNGLELAGLLEAFAREIHPLSGRWHFVTHSMGGLVTRSALYQAEKAGMAFTGRVDKVFLLATPNRGAPLEKGVQAARLVLQAAPYLPFRYAGLGLKKILGMIPAGREGATLAPVGWTADFFIRQVPTFTLKLAARILDLRSDGIVDLRHGYLLREEWEGGESWGGLKSRKLPVPPLAHARYYAVAGCISKKEASGPSPLRIDGMVSTASAANQGPEDELRFVENNRYCELPGVFHFVMPFSPEVYRVLARWFAEDRAQA